MSMLVLHPMTMICRAGALTELVAVNVLMGTVVAVGDAMLVLVGRKVAVGTPGVAEAGVTPMTAGVGE